MKRIILFFSVVIFSIFCFLFSGNSVLAQDFGQPVNLIYLQKGDVKIDNPENFQLFYDELKGNSRNYFIDSTGDFNLYFNILVPAHINPKGKYSAKMFSLSGSGEEQIVELDGKVVEKHDLYNSFDREWYLKGVEIEKQFLAGRYRIEIYSEENETTQANAGRYVLNIGKNKTFDPKSFANAFWQLPWMKMTFSGTPVLEFFLTPTGIAWASLLGGFLIFIAVIYYLIGFIKLTIKHNEAKTLLLTSNGMPEMKDEIIKLLQKPAYDVTVVFIVTAAKPETNKEYLQKDWQIMKEELGFNVEEFDIENKTQIQVMNFLKNHDIIFVEGGNAVYLLNAMRKCNFEKVIRELMKLGKVYIGASAGSIVVGKTVRGEKDLKGLGLVPFDIFCHYRPEYDEIIKQKIPDAKKRAKTLRIITDQQAILVQGKEVNLIGDGEEVIL